jgi:hypothetical protein
MGSVELHVRSKTIGLGGPKSPLGGQSLRFAETIAPLPEPWGAGGGGSHCSVRRGRQWMAEVVEPMRLVRVTDWGMTALAVP